MEISQTDSDPPRRAQRVWLVLFLVLAAGSLLIGTVVPGPDPDVYFLGISLGFIFGGVGIVAIWFAWESLPYRVSVAIFFHFVLMTAFGFYVGRTGGPSGFILIGCATILLQSAVTQLPLWILRSRSGYRLASRDQLTDDESKPQFSIANILVVTSVLALTMSLARLVLPEISLLSGSSTRTMQWAILFTLTGVGSVMVTLAALWYMASRRVTTLLAGFALWTVVLVAQVYQFTSVVHLEKSLMFGVSIHFTVAFTVGTMLFALYRSGRRISVAAQGL